MSQPLSYDPAVDALAITLAKGGRVAHTRELAPGILADFDARGTMLSLEILDARERVGQQLFAEFMKRPNAQVTLADAAAQLGVTAATLRQQLGRGRLSGVKVGRDWFVSSEEIARYKRRVSRNRAVGTTSER